METITGTQLGHYTVTQHLAHGGMSEVYLAYDENSEQLYALKVVEQADRDCYQRFQREVQTMSKARHTHILPILDYGEARGLSYYAMPYIAYGTLKERLDNGPLSPQEAEIILAQIGEALQCLHEAGLLHRDIKPGNILMDEAGRAWLADFGLAKEIEGDQDLTATGCVIGTPSYMAPELSEGPASRSSDIYALGVVLFEMLTGQRPFTGTTALEICWKHTSTPPPLPSTLNPQIPPAIEEVVMRALAKRPEARFKTPREMVEAYHQALSAPAYTKLSATGWLGEAISAAMMKSTSPNAITQSTFLQKRPLAVSMVLLAMLLTLGAGTLAFEVQSQPATAANRAAQIITIQDRAASVAGSAPSISTPTATQVPHHAAKTPYPPAQTHPAPPPPKRRKHVSDNQK